jgi:hypothetical protein
VTQQLQFSHVSVLYLWMFSIYWQKHRVILVWMFGPEINKWLLIEFFSKEWQKNERKIKTYALNCTLSPRASINDFNTSRTLSLLSKSVTSWRSWNNNLKVGSTKGMKGSKKKRVSATTSSRRVKKMSDSVLELWQRDRIQRKKKFINYKKKRGYNFQDIQLLSISQQYHYLVASVEYSHTPFIINHTTTILNTTIKWSEKERKRERERERERERDVWTWGRIVSSILRTHWINNHPIRRRIIAWLKKQFPNYITFLLNFLKVVEFCCIDRKEK